jgi:mRNA interferase MazF
VFLEGNKNNLRQDSTILFEQIRIIDKSRLRAYLTCLDDSIMLEINAAISVSFGLELMAA